MKRKKSKMKFFYFDSCRTLSRGLSTSILIIIFAIFFILLMFIPREIIFAGTPTPSPLPVADTPDPQNSTLAINFTCNGCNPQNAGELIKLYVCNSSTCDSCTLTNTYPTSNATFGNSSAKSNQFSPNNTLNHDGNEGYILTTDDSNTIAEEANWTWDFGSDKTGNFSVMWRAKLEPFSIAGFYDYNVSVKSSVKNSSGSWIDITTDTLIYSTKNFTSHYNDTIAGTYRYIRVSLSSNQTSEANVTLWVDYARVQEDLTSNCWCNSSAVSGSPWCTYTNTSTCNNGTRSYWGRLCAWQYPFPWACNQTLEQTFTYNKENGCSCIQSTECFSTCCQGNGLCGNDCINPQYSYNNSNTTTPGVGDPVLIYANWTDNVGLGWAWLWTNETGGSGKNWTSGSYGPIDINLTGTQTWSNFTWQNSSVTGGTVVAWKIYANDTAGNENVTGQMTFTVQSSWLEVSLIEPGTGYTTSIKQNDTLNVNATVYCRVGQCGNVYGTIRYNGSSANPDTPINTTKGDRPFYNVSGLIQQSCPTNSLDANEFCNLTWTINATDDYIKSWKIGVLFNSSRSDVTQNHTYNATIKILECLESVSISWNSIDFSTLIPSTNYNKAPGNVNNLYNITNTGSCTMKVWIKGTDLQNSSLPSIIGVGNISWSNTTNVSTSSYNMTKNYVILNSSFNTNIPNITTYYWLSVPAVWAGRYNGTITICWNTSQSSGQADSCV